MQRQLVTAEAERDAHIAFTGSRTRAFTHAFTGSRTGTGTNVPINDRRLERNPQRVVDPTCGFTWASE